MNQDDPFRPGGGTITFLAATTPPTAQQAGGPVSGEVSYMVSNLGTAWVALGFGNSAANAAAGAVFPTTGTPQNCILIAPNSSSTYTLPPNSFFTGIVGTGTAAVYVTPGNGT